MGPSGPFLFERSIMPRLWQTHFRWLTLCNGLWIIDDYGNMVPVNAVQSGQSLQLSNKNPH
jgi:hypothetical protein